tara:strand:- start:110988 stop:111404 length:417 start_codon:yes stop_codon:yes gene_type:complete
MKTKKFTELINENLIKGKSIYLAGGWGTWRDTVIDEFKDININWLDPRIAKDKSNWFQIEVDMVRECDLIIAWVMADNKSGFGMTYEMGMAYALGKPYILINEKEDKYQWSMQSSGAYKNFTTHEEAFSWMRSNNWLD